MKIKKKYVFAGVCLAAALFACDEREPAAFDDISGIYFNNRSSSRALLDSVDVTFVYESSDEVEVPVAIQLLGRPTDQARPISIQVTSDDAVQGVDYTLPERAELAAGATSLDYIVTLKRTAALKESKKTIYLEIFANECFALPVTNEIQSSGDTISTLRYRILFSDMFTTAPSAWEEDLLGEFTQQKFELICDVLDIDPADFNDSTVMTLAKQMYIYTEMTAYVAGEVAKKEAGEDYDENAFDENGDPLTFN